MSADADFVAALVSANRMMIDEIARLEGLLMPTPFDYLMPTAEQKAVMETVRGAAAQFAGVLDEALPAGPDKTYVMRALRTVAMWANVCITRQPDGSPRV